MEAGLAELLKVVVDCRIGVRQNTSLQDWEVNFCLFYVCFILFLVGDVMSGELGLLHLAKILLFGVCIFWFERN